LFLALKTVCYKKKSPQSRTSGPYSKHGTLNACGECTLAGNHLCRSPGLICWGRVCCCSELFNDTSDC